VVFTHTPRVEFMLEEGMDVALDQLIGDLVGHVLIDEKQRLLFQEGKRGPHAAIMIGYARPYQTVCYILPSF